MSWRRSSRAWPVSRNSSLRCRSNTDFSRAGSGIQQQLEAYQAVAAELDRLDPAGAARRRQQEAGFIETLRRGLEAQFGNSLAPAKK